MLAKKDFGRHPNRFLLYTKHFKNQRKAKNISRLRWFLSKEMSDFKIKTGTLMTLYPKGLRAPEQTSMRYPWGISNIPHALKCLYTKAFRAITWGYEVFCVYLEELLVMWLRRWKRMLHFFADNNIGKETTPDPSFRKGGECWVFFADNRLP